MFSNTSDKQALLRFSCLSFSRASHSSHGTQLQSHMFRWVSRPTNALIVSSPLQAPKPLPNPSDGALRFLHVLARLPADSLHPHRGREVQPRPSPARFPAERPHLRHAGQGLRHKRNPAGDISPQLPTSALVPPLAHSTWSRLQQETPSPPWCFIPLTPTQQANTHLPPPPQINPTSESKSAWLQQHW